MTDPAPTDDDLDARTAELDAHLDRGEAAYATGDLTTARRAFEAALAHDPTHPRALTDLAVVHHALGETADAERLLLRAIVYGHAPRDALLNLAMILDADDRLAEAATLMAHPALGHHRDFDALTDAATALRDRGQPLVAAHLDHQIRHGRPATIPPYLRLGPPRLTPRQIYPHGAALEPDFFCAHHTPLITLKTPIASIGSCFAREVKDYLVTHGYHYLQTAHGHNARHGSAAWDRVYNTYCLRQEFERALDRFDPRVTGWPSHGTRILDPYRKSVVWTDEDHRRADLDHHRRTAHEALTTCRVLIVTIGVNEIWYDRQSGDVFFQVPPRKLFDPREHAFRTATVEDNLNNLERMHALLATHNPGCQLIVTVSPVPLRATFRPEHNVVVNNAESKATLLVAAKAFVARHDDVHYFPSYELVQHAIRDPFEPDNRHVKRSTVDAIMQVFEATFVARDPMASE